MKTIKAIDVKSVVKLSAVLGVVAGTLVGLIYFLVNLVDRRVMEAFITLLMAPVLYGVVGALVNGLMAMVYNKIVPKLGGIRLTIED